MLQTDVKVFGLVRLHAAEGHPRLPDELIMCQLVFVAHGHPGSERQKRGGEVQMRKSERRRWGSEANMNKNKSCGLMRLRQS